MFSPSTKTLFLTVNRAQGTTVYVYLITRRKLVCAGRRWISPPLDVLFSLLLLPTFVCVLVCVCVCVLFYAVHSSANLKGGTASVQRKLPCVSLHMKHTSLGGAAKVQQLYRRLSAYTRKLFLRFAQPIFAYDTYDNLNALVQVYV